MWIVRLALRRPSTFVVAAILLLLLTPFVLLDDATVTIENVERHLSAGETLENGIMVGAGEIALPALVSTTCICIVFVPMFFLTGVARYLFAPLAEAVIFAVLASYALSRTLVPTLVMWLERGVHRHGGETPPSSVAPSKFSALSKCARALARFQQGFEHAFDHFRQRYRDLLAWVLAHRLAFGTAFLAFCGASWLLVSRNTHNFVYSRFNLMRASWVVKRQSMVMARLFRSCSQAATSFLISSMLGILRLRHCPLRALSSISATLSQLPCLGV